MDGTPDIYFAGGQSEAGWRLHESAASGSRTLLLAVPSFAKTRTALFVDMETLEVVPAVFGDKLAGGDVVGGDVAASSSSSFAAAAAGSGMVDE